MTGLSNKAVSKALHLKKRVIMAQVMQRQFELNPQLKLRYTPHDIVLYQKDTEYHLDFLSQSIVYDSRIIFRNYIVWVRQLFKHLHIPEEHLTEFFQCIKEVIQQGFEPEAAQVITQYLDYAISELTNEFVDTVTYLDTQNHYTAHAQHLLHLLLEGKKNQAAAFVLDLVNNGLSIRDCYLELIQPMQYEVGRLWQAHKISVAQEHYVTSAAQLIMSQFYPQIMNHPRTGKTMLAVCINGEQHEIGLRMVSDLMELDGWDTHFYGANTPIASIADLAKKHKARLLAVSATLSTNLESVELLISDVHSKLPELKVLVGGYPFNLDKDLWQKVGANGYGRDAIEAINTANKLIETNREAGY